MMCVGLDVHAKWTTVVALDSETGATRRVDRVPNEPEAFQKVLGELGGPLHGVMEAGWNSWAVYDLLEPLFIRLLMADPAEMKRRMSGRGAKTDRRDALQMALLLAENRIPAIWVPDRSTRDPHQPAHHASRQPDPRHRGHFRP
jgi:transposase